MHQCVATSAPRDPATPAVSAQAANDALAADLALHPNRHRMLTGDRPTGPLHLGHYLASLRDRVRVQDLGVSTFVVIADYQVLTDRGHPGELREHVLGAMADYLATGIDPDRTTIFTQSAVPALNQLMLPFLALVSRAELERNPTVKAELAASRRPMSGLLLTYPAHQAADILFAKADVVPVGRDQLPHLEQARVIARRFNTRYGAGQEIFPEPRPLLNAAATILGLDGAKMSTSRGNAIPLGATQDETADLVRRAKTDAQRRITYDPVGRRRWPICCSWRRCCGTSRSRPSRRRWAAAGLRR